MSTAIKMIPEICSQIFKFQIVNDIDNLDQSCQSATKSWFDSAVPVLSFCQVFFILYLYLYLHSSSSGSRILRVRCAEIWTWTGGQLMKSCWWSEGEKKKGKMDYVDKKVRCAEIWMWTGGRLMKNCWRSEREKKKGKLDYVDKKSEVRRNMDADRWSVVVLYW